MKQMTKTLGSVAAALIFAVAANAQTSNAKLEKIVIDKTGEEKAVSLSIKPDETKDIAVVEIKMDGTFVITAAGTEQTGGSAENTPGGGGTTVTNRGAGGAMGGIVTSNAAAVVIISDNSPLTSGHGGTHFFGASINWILKKDGKEAAAGNDAYEKTTLNGRIVNLKYASNHAKVEPGTYVLAFKCLRKTVCEFKQNFLVTPANVSQEPIDPANMPPL